LAARWQTDAAVGVRLIRYGFLGRPFFGWRHAPGWGHEASLGYRFNEHLSVEIHYSGIGEDRGEKKEKLGLRGVLSL